MLLHSCNQCVINVHWLPGFVRHVCRLHIIRRTAPVVCTLVWYIMHWCMNWMCQTLSASGLCLVISESGVYFLLQFQTIVRTPLVIPPQFVFHIPLQDILANLPVCLLTWPNHLRCLFLTILPVSALNLSIIEQFENVSHVLYVQCTGSAEVSCRPSSMHQLL